MWPGLRRELILLSSLVDFSQVRERPTTYLASHGGSEYSFALFFFVLENNISGSVSYG